MNSTSSQSLLSAEDPAPVRILNPAGASAFLLLGDHAGNAIPASLKNLGVGSRDRERHIAWDIGIAGLGEKLAVRLNAPFISQVYSRLVVDCNRDPAADAAVPDMSDGTPVPGNVGLSPARRAMRIDEIHAPYHAAISTELARRDGAGASVIIVSLHSFTPSMQGQVRPWDIGVLYSDGDHRFAVSVLRQLKSRSDLVVGDNEPYAMDATDYTIPTHAFAARRPYIEIEIRQDLLVSSVQQAKWVELLAETLSAALVC